MTSDSDTTRPQHIPTVADSRSNRTTHRKPMSLRRRAVIALAVIVGLFVAVLWISSPSSTPQAPLPVMEPVTSPVTTIDPKQPGPPQDIRVDVFTEGAWDVGTAEGEIRPGRYRTDGAPEDDIFPFCVAQKNTKDGTPKGMPITTNNGPAFFTIRSEDESVTFSGPCEWAAFRR